MSKPTKEAKEAATKVANAATEAEKFSAELELLLASGWKQSSLSFGKDSPATLYEHPVHRICERWAAVRCCLADLALSMLEHGSEKE